jgi:hypothetical protein
MKASNFEPHGDFGPYLEGLAFIKRRFAKKKMKGT